MIRFRSCSIRIRQLRGRILLRRFMRSVTKRIARFTLCLLITRKNWKRPWCNAGIVAENICELLRLRQHRQSHLLRPLDTHQESGRTVTVGARCYRSAVRQDNFLNPARYKLLPDLNDSLPSSISKSFEERAFVCTVLVPRVLN